MSIDILLMRLDLLQFGQRFKPHRVFLSDNTGHDSLAVSITLDLAPIFRVLSNTFHSHMYLTFTASLISLQAKSYWKKKSYRRLDLYLLFPVLFSCLHSLVITTRCLPLEKKKVGGWGRTGHCECHWTVSFMNVSAHKLGIIKLCTFLSTQQRSLAPLSSRLCSKDSPLLV